MHTTRSTVKQTTTMPPRNHHDPLGPLLAYSLMLATAFITASGIPMTKGQFKGSIVQNDTCPVVVNIARDMDHALVRLDERVQFLLEPNEPRMNLVITAGDQIMYKASVEGTMLILEECDARGYNCVLVDQGGTKSYALITPYKWNLVQVSYNDGEVSVDINMANVMGVNMMPVPRGTPYSVAFTVPPSSPQYQATLKVRCDEYGVPPYIIRVTPDLPAPPRPQRPHSPMDYEPFPDCPVYQVMPNHATPTTHGDPFLQEFTFAIYPNQDSLQMDVFTEIMTLKFLVRGSLAEVRHCSSWAGRECSLEDSVHGGRYSFITPAAWNRVKVSLWNNMLDMRVNGTLVLSSYLPSGEHKGVKVVVSAPLTKTSPDYYDALVNVECVGIRQQPMTHPGTASTTAFTVEGFPTKDSIVEITSPKPDTPGVTRDVGIAVGVLLGVLLIIALAIAITVYRKRRVAPLNEHSPLQNQQQPQQQQYK